MLISNKCSLFTIYSYFFIRYINEFIIVVSKPNLSITKSHKQLKAMRNRDDFERIETTRRDNYRLGN